MHTRTVEMHGHSYIRDLEEHSPCLLSRIWHLDFELLLESQHELLKARVQVYRA